MMSIVIELLKFTWFSIISSALIYNGITIRNWSYWLIMILSGVLYLLGYFYGMEKRSKL